MRSWGLNTLRGASSTAMRSAISWNAFAVSPRGRRRRWAGRRRHLRGRGHQRQLGEEDAELVGELLAAPGTEELVALAVVAGEPRHVLDDPRTGRWTLAAIAADRRATFCAAGWGVVTASTSACGRYWLEAQRDVTRTGGMSTSRYSGSSQNTSVRNCSSALWSIGPRQMTAWPSGTK